MSRTLSEVLHEYAVKQHAQFEATRAKREEWVEAVRRLMKQLVAWLREADRDGVLDVREEEHDVREEALGWYTAPGLQVRLGAREVSIRPMGRSTIARLGEPGAERQTAGMVQVSDGGERYSVYRVLDEAGERWELFAPDSRHSTPLTREAFEGAMARLLG